MANEISTIGASLKYRVGNTSFITVPNLETYPDLGTFTASKIEVTNTSDSSERFIDGVKEVPKTLDFNCVYEKSTTGNYATLNKLYGIKEIEWKFTIGDSMSIGFFGSCNVTLLGAGINEVVKFVLSISPNSDITISMTEEMYTLLSTLSGDNIITRDSENIIIVNKIN